MRSGFLIGLLMGTAGSLFLIQSDKVQQAIKNMKR
jgi:hypothetical protein